MITIHTLFQTHHLRAFIFNQVNYINSVWLLSLEEHTPQFILQHYDVSSRWLQRWFPDIKITNELIEVYARNERAKVDTFEYLYDRNTSMIDAAFTRTLMNVISMYGQFELIMYMIENRGEVMKPQYMDKLAEYGHIDIIKYFTENKRKEKFTTRAIDLAAENGYLEIVQYITENRTEGCSTNALDWAAFSSHMSVVRYLVMNRTEGGTYDTLERAYRNQSEPMFEYIIQNKHRLIRHTVSEWEEESQES